MKITKSSKKSSQATSSKTVLGLDISDSSVKAIQVSGKSLSSLKVDAYAIRQLPPNTVSDGKMTSGENLVAALQQMFRGMGNVKSLVLGVPTNIVTTLNFDYDPKSGMDLEQASEYEVVQVANVEDVSFDFVDITKNDDGTSFVMIGMAKQEDIEPYKGIMESIGVDISYIDLELAARVNAYSYWINQYSTDLENRVVGIFDIGELGSQALFVQSGKILFKQEFGVAGKTFTREIQKSNSCNQDEAENLKCSGGLAPSDPAIESYRQQVASEIQRVMQFFNTLTTVSSSTKVDQLLITGGGSICPGLADTVTDNTGITARVINPVSSLGLSKKVDQLAFDVDSARLTVAFGLALRGLI